MSKKRNIQRSLSFYESEPSVLTINLHTGVPGNFAVKLGIPAQMGGVYKSRGGIFTFGRYLNNKTELHAIRIHETVEASIVRNSGTSLIYRIQPFDIISDSAFLSRGIKSASIHTESGTSVVLASDETAKWIAGKGDKSKVQIIDAPSQFAIVSSTSGKTPSGKRIACLYMDSGNIYAGVEYEP